MRVDHGLVLGPDDALGNGLAVWPRALPLKAHLQGHGTPTATVGVPCRLAAINSYTLTGCSTLVAFPVKFFCSVSLLVD
ncbi:hypothetical protein BCL80_11520 [Streptomyces avidinii]|nr:hypothetical protein BCL80_11520 [Streptomyces avidinii]SNX80825.1 hypothetical protein SAMN05421860_11320 [Streptomyces microflavus]